jgi:DNA-binding NtrC family response regulator
MVEPSILLADDDADLCRYCTTALKPLGVRIDAARRKKRALTLWKRSLSTCLLGRKTSSSPMEAGWNSWKRRAKKTPQASYVLITGKGTITKPLDAMKRGAFDYLLKPSASPAIARQRSPRRLPIAPTVVENRT